MPQPKDKDWLNGYKNKTPIYVVHLKTRDTYRLKVKGCKKIFHANGDQKKMQEQQYLDNIDFKTKAVKRDKDGHYIMIKGSIQEENTIIINIHAPNIGAPQYVRQMLKDILQTGNTERVYRPEPKTIKSMAMGSYLSIITLNISGLNAPTKRQTVTAPTKRQRLAEWL